MRQDFYIYHSKTLYAFLSYFVALIANCTNRKKLSSTKDSFHDADDTFSPITPKTIKRIQNAWNKLICSLKKYTLMIVISSVPTPDQIA
jgi:hypothetical protein